MNILVPFDFTPITRTALKHALALHPVLGGSIELLHVVGNAGQKEEILDRFRKEVDALDEHHRALVKYKVRVGDIFQDLTREAQEGGAQLLVMGSHGDKGLQKVLGSKAIR